MIPLWLTAPCFILLLIIICRWLLTLNISWKAVLTGVKEIAMTAITVFCIVVVILSICQWIIQGVK